MTPPKDTQIKDIAIHHRNHRQTSHLKPPPYTPPHTATKTRIMKHSPESHSDGIEKLHRNHRENHHFKRPAYIPHPTTSSETTHQQTRSPGCEKHHRNHRQNTHSDDYHTPIPTPPKKTRRTSMHRRQKALKTPKTLKKQENRPKNHSQNDIREKNHQITHKTKSRSKDFIEYR